MLFREFAGPPTGPTNGASGGSRSAADTGSADSLPSANVSAMPLSQPCPANNRVSDPHMTLPMEDARRVAALHICASAYKFVSGWPLLSGESARCSRQTKCVTPAAPSLKSRGSPGLARARDARPPASDHEIQAARCVWSWLTALRSSATHHNTRTH